MIELLLCGKQHGWTRLLQAVDQALALGCTDAAAVRHLLTAAELTHPHPTVLDLGELERYKRPLPVMKEYDLLLSAAEVTR